jgi:hypothetical protein
MALNKTAAGNAPDTGSPPFSRVANREKKSGVPVNSGDAYGENGYGGPSSETVIGKTRADMTVNNDGSDPALEAAKAKRTTDTGPQMRTVSDTPLAAAFGHKRQTSDSPATLPSKIGATNAPVARKP